MSYTEVIIRLLLAIVIGGAIGYERENKNMPAGFRTNILVCVGAAVVSMIQLQSIEDLAKMVQNNPALANVFKADVGRLGAQVISGIGFLGAGSIIHEKGSVRGLTTAASLWVVACIGLAVGLGYYYLTIISALSVFLVLVSLKRFEKRFLGKNVLLKLEIEYTNESEMVNSLAGYFNSKKIKIKNIEFAEEDIKACTYTVLVPKNLNVNDIMDDLSMKNEILKINIE
ncbi:MAG: MgtC/SapB family protein [Bacillota bacterium]|nr:MgtC/SapB family protein [Bacillota bacterium]